MLLETLDVKKNDVLIYSQNIFNTDRNFKIVFKDDPERIARKINYADVCRFVNEFNPKNLIVYRLLTNIADFQIDLSKYGFLLYINGERELIYFDPVFAVKELEEYNKIISLYNLRFRIQQVGLTTLSRKNGLPNFAEIYSVDLEAIEAKFQNDKVFADAIFSFDTTSRHPSSKKAVEKANTNKNEEENISGKDKKKSFAEKVKSVESVQGQLQKENGAQLKHEVSEVKDFDYKQIIKMNYKGKTLENEIDKNDTEKTSKKQLKDQKHSESDFKKFLNRKLTSKEKAALSKGNEFVDIFKSATPLKEYIAQKENKKIVLQLKNK
ncbi:MAG TPA: hypothetical protein VKA26_01290 [Ignavibacteriaceae bacterium]|nr:hypothetical protein [Ignavibacteriaceae bacterium]